MSFIVGIDEVGRGPLAGPVSVGIVLCAEEIYPHLRLLRSLPKQGIDSKKLLPEEREEYSLVLKNLRDEGKISYSIVHISNQIIDEKGLTFAIKKAINTGIKLLNISCDCQVLLDGGLRLPKKFKLQKTIIRGDEKEKIIAWASILAKVARDNIMCEHAKTFPQYGFEYHKGYATRQHFEAIYEHGLSDIHRKSWKII